MEKDAQLTFNKKTAHKQAKQVLMRICCDLSGPMEILALNGERNVMVLLDQLSHYVEVACLQIKDSADDQ